jgi:adenylate cyclase
VNPSALDRLRVAAVGCVAAMLVAHGAAWLLAPQVDAWNGRLLDPLLRLRASGGATREPSPVAFVELSDADRLALMDHGTDTDRAAFARVIANLASLDPAAIAVDVVFAGARSPADDQALVAATLSRVPIYYGMAFQTAEDGAAPDRLASADEEWIREQSWSLDGSDEAALPRGSSVLSTVRELASASRGLGVLNVEPDADGVHRWLPLVIAHDDHLYPTLALKVFADANGLRPHTLDAGRAGWLTLIDQRGERRAAIPVDETARLRLSFPGGWMDAPFRHYRFADVWRGFSTQDERAQWRDELAGRFIVVCDIATGSDVGPTPVDTRMPLAALHAVALHMFLTGDYLPDASPSLLLMLELAMLALIATAAVRYSPRALLACAAALVLLLMLLVVSVFWWLQAIVPPVRPGLVLAISATVTVAGRYLVEDRERRLLERSFGMYFPPAVASRIVRDPEFVTEGGERREITVLFSDICGFTPMAAGADPREVRDFFNEYFGAMTDIVFAHGGTLDKFIGDGLMAFFGAPDAQPDHATRAVEAAIAMQRHVAALEGRLRLGGHTSIRIRIGVNTGDAIVGNLGPPQRLTYTALGDAVNLAQRLEAAATPGGILIGERCRELLAPRIATSFRGAVGLKGVELPVKVHEVVWDAPGPDRAESR